MDIDLGTLRRSEAYALLTSFIVPRPIGFVSTTEPGGHSNVAPFSYFSGLGSDPAMCTLGIANKRDGSEKDTLRIARATGVLCVNLVEEAVISQVVQASGDYPPHESEVVAAGLRTVACAAIEGVRIGECRAALECRLVDVHTYGREAKTNLLVCEVVHAWIDDAIVDAAATSPRIDAHAITPVARLGGPHYAKLGERFSVDRPKP